MKAFSDLMISSFKHLFILYLVISGNFIGNTFSCKLQKLLQNNMIFKHLIGFMLLFFFNVFIGESRDISPLNQLLYTLVVYIIFIITTKTNIYFLLIVIFIMFINYLLNETIYFYKNKYDKNDKNDKNDKKEDYLYKINLIKKIQFIICIIMVSLILIGFVIYIIQKYNEYNKEFKISKFLFGIPNCKGL